MPVPRSAAATRGTGSSAARSILPVPRCSEGWNLQKAALLPATCSRVCGFSRDAVQFPAAASPLAGRSASNTLKCSVALPSRAVAAAAFPRSTIAPKPSAADPASRRPVLLPPCASAPRETPFFPECSSVPVSPLSVVSPLLPFCEHAVLPPRASSLSSAWGPQAWSPAPSHSVLSSASRLHCSSPGPLQPSPLPPASPAPLLSEPLPASPPE